MTTEMANVLAVDDLGVVWEHRRGPVPILDGVSLSIAPGETVALVGESGAGKSMLALAVMGLLPDGIHVERGSIVLDGDELVGATPATIREKRGGQMAMIFQDPLSSLHPAFRVGDQIAEALRTHGTCATKSRRRRSGGRAAGEWWACRNPTPGYGTTRTSSPAGCGNG